MSASTQQLKSATMSEQKVRATLQSLQENKELGNAVLIFLGALYLLVLFQFYPIYISFLLALACGLAAYRFPQVGIIMGIIFAIPALSYQAPLFVWPFMLIISLVLFQMHEDWDVIAFLEIIVCAPFAPLPFSLLSGFVPLLMVLGAFRTGSQRSIVISIPAVCLILLLSSLWIVQNSAFMPITNLGQFTPKIDALQHDIREEVGLLELPSKAAASVVSIFSYDIILKQITPSLGKIADNMLKLFIADSGLLHIFLWGAILFLAGWLPGNIKSNWKQTVGALSLLGVPAANLLLSAFGVPFMFSAVSVIYIVISIAIVALLDFCGVDLSRERLIERRRKTKKFGKFGVQDMAESTAEKSLDDVGNYNDVKAELREAIITPLLHKELSFTYGIKPPSGVLLFGPPGTGKTMLMRALSKEMSYGFYNVKTSELLSQWYGESLPYDEEIMIMENGAVKLAKIGEIVEQRRDAKVLSFDEKGKAVFAEIAGHIKHKCTSPIYEVRTRSGRRIRVTGYHSLFTIDGSSVKSIETSKLKAGFSYIAIPSRVEFPSAPVGQLDFLGSLKHADYGLRVTRVRDYVKLAVEKIGANETHILLGLKNTKYLKYILSREKEISLPAGRFIALMERTGISYDSSKILVCTGKGACKGLPGIIKLDGELALFLGLWVAEGSYTREDTVRVSTSDCQLGKIAELCAKLFGKIIIYEKKRASSFPERRPSGEEREESQNSQTGNSKTENFRGVGRGRDIYIPGRVLYVFMRHFLGLEHGAERKKAPVAVFSLDRLRLAAFLRGYFSGDGTVYENQKGIGTVEACTASKTLASQLLYLLLYFGIVATVREKMEWSGALMYRIFLTGEPFRGFGQIGFLDDMRNKRYECALEAGSWHRDVQIPLSGELKEWVFRNLKKYSEAGSATIGRQILLMKHTKLGASSTSLEKVVNGDIYWDRVEEIRQVADEEFVYDISVEPCQNFAGGFGGIFAHNSEKNVAEIFKVARENAPSILFFDEIDSIGKKRELYSADDVAPRVMSVFLTELDGYKGATKPVMVIGTTNVPNMLDAALLRPGRFDKIIYMKLPDPEGRKDIFKVQLSKLPTANIDLGLLAKKTDRFSGADIANVCREAARFAAADASKQNKILPITMEHLLRVLDNVRPSVGLEQLEEYEQFRLDFERRVGRQVEKKKEDAVRWADVVGLDEVKTILLDAIELPLLHEDLMEQYKVKPYKGMLLFGPPGCGKTFIVKAAANELKATFQFLSGAELLKKGYANSIRVLKETFNRAKEQAPAIIFIDEIETVAPSRELSDGGLVGQLLSELDGVRELKNVLLIGATNKPEILDPALMRPGRFDKIVFIPPPDLKARANIFQRNLEGVAAGAVIDYDELSRLTEGFSAADITSICQGVKLEMVKKKLRGIEPHLSMAEIFAVIKGRRPSISLEMLQAYYAFMKTYGER
ncbi:TPA: AAA family ATPase, partial [Candidatus Micrarchaeota archaeon]|nr:AAA family ATPase [Candidatus Micrarchaeota archaeon]